MEIYRLTPTGKAIARTVRNDRNKPEVRVLDFLYKQGGSATDDNIISFISGTNRMLLARMCQKGYLTRGV